MSRSGGRVVFGVLMLCALLRAQSVNPVPFINNPLVPTTVAPGGPGFTLTVNGTGFESCSTVYWNGSPRTTTFVSGSRLSASIDAADVASAATAAVTVRNPVPGGGTSNVVLFSVTRRSQSVTLKRSDVSVSQRGYPLGIFAGDLNADGRADIAVGTGGSFHIAVLIGNGDGAFQPPQNYNAAAEPFDVAVGDFNGDGILDLATSNVDPSNVSVLLGNGDGTFHFQTDYPAGTNPEGIVTADFNGDGALDLATSNISGSVSVLLGNGDGTFKPHVDYLAGNSATDLCVGDFNRDGTLDLATANASKYSNSISVLLGFGDGTFMPHVDYAAGNVPVRPRTADFNGDGILDLVVGDEGLGFDSGHTFSILLGNGDGTFQHHVDYPIGGYFLAGLAVADFNADGYLDVMTSSYVSSVVSLSLGYGDGTFRKSTEYTANGGNGPAAVADFNGDGRLDYVTSAELGKTVSIFLQAAVVFSSSEDLTYPVQLLGTRSAQQRVALINVGSAPLVVAGIGITGDFLQRNDCPESLDADEGCTLHVVFRPTGEGTRTGTITISDNAADSPQRITLTGTGTVVQLSASSLNFGDQKVGTSSSPQRFSIMNRGSDALNITTIAVGGQNAGDFGFLSNCPPSLAPGASCSVSVTFSPKAKGARQAALTIGDDGRGSPQKVVLAGNGI